MKTTNPTDSYPQLATYHTLWKMGTSHRRGALQAVLRLADIWFCRRLSAWCSLGLHCMVAA